MLISPGDGTESLDELARLPNDDKTDGNEDQTDQNAA
jgi:hypothetical protein